MTNRIEDLVRVSVIFKGGVPTQDLIIREADVVKLVEAFVKLHHKPGINPHTGGKTAELAYIVVERNLVWRGPFWWTTPALQRNGDEEGVRVLGGDPTVEWM